MEKGVIEGKRARKYESEKKDSQKDKKFDEFILKNVRSGKSVRVCDFCCGPGNNIELLKNRVSEIIGIDLSHEMIKICKEKFSKVKSIELRYASVTDTKLGSNHFDYIIIRKGLHHVKDKEKVIEEAYRLLKPKGKFIIIDKYYVSLFGLYLRAFYKLIFKRNPAIFHEYMISKRKYDELFYSSKFKIIKKEILPYEIKLTGGTLMYVLEKL